MQTRQSGGRAADVDGENGREGWLVMTRLEGRDLRSEIQSAGPQRRVELYRVAGQLLRRLHAAPVPPGLRSDEPWLDRMLSRAEQNLPWCDGTAAQLAELRRHRPPAAPDVLIHGDLALDNVLVDAKGSMSLIDWSGGDAGDPRYDVSLSLRTETTAVSADEFAAFFEGYEDAPVDDATRQWFETLYDFF